MSGVIISTINIGGKRTIAIHSDIIAVSRYRSFSDHVNRRGHSRVWPSRPVARIPIAGSLLRRRLFHQEHRQLGFGLLAIGVVFGSPTLPGKLELDEHLRDLQVHGHPPGPRVGSIASLPSPSGQVRTAARITMLFQALLEWAHRA